MKHRVEYIRKNKYNAKQTRYGDRLYHSAKEAGYAQQLDWLLRAGEILSWEPQFKISIDVNGVHIANYFMDFKVTRPDGVIEMHEVKGAETMLWRIKWRLAKALNPQWQFVLIK